MNNAYMHKVFTVGKKVHQAAALAGWTTVELADALGIARTTAIAYRNRDNANPSVEAVERMNAILEQQGISIPMAWYYDGQDSPIPSRKPTNPLSDPMAVVSHGYRNIRYAGVVPCGDWGDPLDSEEMLPISAELEHPKRFAATVVGDSCYPALLQGDLTIWHADLAPAPGLIVLAQRKGDHGCTVKQLRLDEHGRPRLVPINPAHSEPPNGDGWGVIAKLIAVIRQGDRIKHQFTRTEGIRPEDMI